MKRLLSLLLAAAVVLGCAALAAAGGGKEDPLVSLSFLEATFQKDALGTVRDMVNASGEAAYEAALNDWRTGLTPSGSAAGAQAGGWRETRLKDGDVIVAPPGTQVLMLSGSAQLAAGIAVDVTAGAEAAPGGALGTRRRYLAAEGEGARFTVTSRTAVFDYCGGVTFGRAGFTPDYNAMAYALRSLSLFQGTDTGYGDGLDLETAPTRIQAIIMLIRLLGEESAALACSSPSPFSDIPDSYWGRPYAVYAYEKGYTNGVEDNKFAPDRPASAAMYIEFILRALGYSDTRQTDISTSAVRAAAAGVLTAGERDTLVTRTFLRADVVYLSWYALQTSLGGGPITLADYLESGGVFTEEAFTRARAGVTTDRIR